MGLRGAVTAALMATSVGAVIVAQSGAAARFDVVSVRPVENTSFRLSQAAEILLHVTEAGQLVGRSSLRGIIGLAYRLEPYERVVAAEPDAASFLEEWFEIRALPAPAPSPPDRDDVMAMTRQMLAERFGVAVRVDTEVARATVVGLIEPGVLGPGLQPAPDGCTPLPRGSSPYDERFADAYRSNCALTLADDRLRGTVTLDEFARFMSSRARRPILNRTGLEGLFTIDVAVARASYMRDLAARSGLLGQPVPTAPSDAPAFVDALRDQMGLSTGTERHPIRQFVVERIGPFVEN